MAASELSSFDIVLDEETSNDGEHFVTVRYRLGGEIHPPGDRGAADLAELSRMLKAPGLYRPFRTIKTGSDDPTAQVVTDEVWTEETGPDVRVVHEDGLLVWSVADGTASVTWRFSPEHIEAALRRACATVRRLQREEGRYWRRLSLLPSQTTLDVCRGFQR